MVELHPDPLELRGVGEVVAGDDQQRGEVDAGVLVGLDFESASVPVNGLKFIELAFLFRMSS